MYFTWMSCAFFIMRVTKQINSSNTSLGYHIFMHIAKRIPDESSKGIVQDEFDVFYGMKSLSTISSYLPQDLYSEFDDQNTVNWKRFKLGQIGGELLA